MPNFQKIPTYLPVFTGFYGSMWDEPDFYSEADEYNLSKDFNFWDFFKWDEYKKDLSIRFCELIEECEELKPFIKKVEFQAIDSPKYYNFTNDKIDCLITIEQEAIRAYIYGHKEKFEKHLVDHHKSRDGFMSFYSHHFETWRDEYTNDFTNFAHDSYVILASILQFIAENEGVNMDLFYYRHEIYPSMYLNDDFYNFVNGKKEEVTKFIQENYTKYSYNELINKVSELYEEEENINLILESAKDAINEIEDQTLKLIF